MNAQIESTETVAPSSLESQLEPVTTALAKIDKVAAGIADLRGKYANVVFAVATAKGMKEACEARAEIREPRYEVEKLRKAAKRPILDLGKKLDSEAERITNELLAIEAPVDSQIKAEEQRKADEKRAKEEAEAKRIATIRGRIEDDIRAIPLAAMDRSARDIRIFIGDIEAMVIDHTFAEFQKEAEGARATTLIRLRAALANALKLEEQQRELEAQRIENERIRQENEVRAEADRVRIAKENAALVARQEAQAVEEARIEAQRQEEARQREAVEEAQRAEAQRIADERAQLERDQEALRVEREQSEPITPIIVGELLYGTQPAHPNRLSNTLTDEGRFTPESILESMQSMMAMPDNRTSVTSIGEGIAAMQYAAIQEPSRPTNADILHILMTMYGVSEETVLTWLAELVAEEIIDRSVAEDQLA